MTVYCGACVCVFVPLRLEKSPLEPLDCALYISNWNQHGCSPVTTGVCFHLIILSVKHFFLSFFPSALEKGEWYVTLSLLRGQVVIADVVCSKHV